MFSRVAYSQWIIRGLAVIIAVILWRYVYNQDRVTRSTPIPIEFIHKPNKKDLFSYFDFSNQEVMAHVTGKKGDVKTAIDYLRSPLYLKGVVDLGKAKKGKSVYPIKKEKALDNKIFNEVEITLDRDVIHIPFQEIIEVTVPVKPLVKDLNGKQYKVLGWEYIPKKVRIKGLEDEINKIKSVKTKVHSIKNKKKDYTVKLSFKRLPRHVEILNAKTVTLKVKIDHGIRERVFKNVKVLTFGISPNSNLTIREKDLKLDSIIYRGMPKALNAINPKDVVAYVVLENKIGEQT
ncbi:MAG TPA: YbbR-like domain-containing protein, partial [Spirochaetes bacterium]|nr:YbbR-like domain-containing protein [Spirochaetota bacterium]